MHAPTALALLGLRFSCLLLTLAAVPSLHLPFNVCLRLAPAVAAPSQKPNVLIIYADDLGFGDLGCYNPNSKIPTPNLDQFASESMRFSDGHSSSGICTPSRYALLTGRYHWRDFHGIVGPMGGSVFAPERLTLPEMMQQSGYHTAAIGKWHLGFGWDAIKQGENYNWNLPIPDGPLAHGFDQYFGDAVINFPPYAWIENDRMLQIPDTTRDTAKWKKIKEGNWECRPGPAYSEWDPYQNIPTTTKRGIDFIKAQAVTDEPFFLYFAFPSPHAPIIPNDQFDGMSQAGAYGDFVVETDHAIGKLLRALEESGQADHTVVIFSADNGPEKYAYARDQKFDHWSATPLRGLKRDLYEGGHHVPFVVRYPGVTAAGSTSDALVSQIDIMATLAAIVRFEMPSQNAAEDSFNLMPLLQGGTDPVRTSLVHNTNKDAYAVRSGDWLLVDHKHGYMSGQNQHWESKHKYAADDDLPVELYNLKVDIGQRVNLAAERADKVAELSELLNTTRMQTSTAPRLQVATDWPSHLSDNQRRGAADVGPPAALEMQWIHTAQRAPEPAWGKPADGSFWQRLESLHARVQFDQVFAPVLFGDRIYYGSSADGSLRCLNAATGQQRWIYHAEGPIRLAPTISGSRIYFGADDGFVYCLSALTGELLWRTLLAPSPRRIPSNGKLISAWPVRTGVVVEGEQLYATCGIFPNYGCWAAQLNTLNGEVQWKTELNQGLSPQGYLLLSKNKLFVPSGRTTPFALSRTDGNYLGQFGGAGGAYALLTDADESADLLSGPGNQGELNLSPASSHVRIATFAGLRMVVDGDISFLQSQTQIVAMDRAAFKLDREKGSLWAIACTHNDAMVLGGDILWAAGLGEFAAYEAATGKLLNTLIVPSEQRILAIAVGRNQIVVSTAGGELISFGLQTPRSVGERNVEQRRRPELRPDGLILHVDVTPQSLLQIKAQRPTAVVVVAAAHVEVKELHRAAQNLRKSAPHVFVEQILPATALDHSADGIANQVVAHPIQLGPVPARYARLLVPKSPFLGAWSHPYADAGNTACSNDPIQTTDLQLQWFGGPGAQPMIDRHLRTSPPISAGGRLFIPGDDLLIAIDVFNGSVLWRKDLPGWTRVGVPYDAGYMAVGASEIFTATQSQALALDVRSGQATRSFQLPTSAMLNAGTGELDWGWLALSDQTLLGSATPKAAARRQQSREDVVEQYGEHRPLIYSQVLMGFGLESCVAPQNQNDWWYQSDGAILNTSLAAGDGNLVFIESTSPAALTSFGRATLHQFFAAGEQHLVCLDNINGTEKWRVPYPDRNERHVIYLCYSDGKILTVGSFNRDDRIWYSVQVWNADDGSLLWQAEHQNNRPGVGGDHGEQVHHPVIQGSRIIAEPAIYDFNTGQRLDQIATESSSIGVPRRGGCGTISASANALFYRDGCPTARQLNIPIDGSRADLQPQVNPLTSTTRPGCWINILPVAGLVVIPEASSGCVCAYPIQTCLALSPK